MSVYAELNCAENQRNKALLTLVDKKSGLELHKVKEIS